MLEYRPGWGGRYYGGYHGVGGGMSTTTSSTNHVASLAFDMFDAAGKKLIWTGRDWHTEGAR